MKCPVCEMTQLKPMERYGIAINYCPQCHGVWLDQEEWDRIMHPSPFEDVEEDYSFKKHKPRRRSFMAADDDVYLSEARRKPRRKKQGYKDLVFD